MIFSHSIKWFILFLTLQAAAGFGAESCDNPVKPVDSTTTLVRQGTGYWLCAKELPVQDPNAPCQDPGFRYLKHEDVEHSWGANSIGENYDLLLSTTFEGPGLEVWDGWEYTRVQSGYSIYGPAPYYEYNVGSGYYYNPGLHLDHSSHWSYELSWRSDVRVNYGTFSVLNIASYSRNSEGTEWSSGRQFRVIRFSKPTAIQLRQPATEIVNGVPEAYYISGTQWQTCQITGRIRTCPGKYKITMHYVKLSIPGGEIVGRDKVEKEKKFEDDMPSGGYEVPFELPTSVCFKSAYVRMEYEAIDGNSCGGGGSGRDFGSSSSGGLTGSSGSSGNGAGPIMSSTSVGQSEDGKDAGAVNYYTDSITSTAFSPASLDLSFGSAAAIMNVKRDGSGNLRQMLVPDGLIDVVPVTVASVPAGFSVNFYPRPSLLVVPDPVTGLYPIEPQATLLASVTYDNPDASSSPGGSIGDATRLRVTRYKDGASPKVDIYEKIGSTGLAYTEEGGARKIVSASSVAGAVTTTTTEGYAPASASLPDDVRAVKTQNFPFGARVIEESRGSGSALVSTSYEYDTVSSSPNYGRLLRVIRSDGGWERHDYDAEGRVTDTWTPLGDAGPGVLDENQLRHVEKEYYDLPNSPYGAGSLVTTIEFAGGVEIARSHRFVASDRSTVTVGQAQKGARIEVESRSPTPGASLAWHDAANALTVTYVGLDGDDEDLPLLTLEPDGSAVFEIRTSTSEGTELRKVSETWRGTLNAARSNLIAGTRSKTATTLNGYLLSEETRDVASAIAPDEGLLLASTLYDNHDSAGRPQTIVHMDGSEETRSYSVCCGQLASVTHRGITTTYGYDALGRREWEKVQAGSGVSLQTISHVRFTYDSAGRVLTRTRVPTSGPEQLIERNVYDNAGTLLSTATPGSLATDAALTRVTTYASAYDSATGRTTRTVTAPGGATEITVTDRAGRTLRRTGTAVAPVRYEYGTATLTDAAEWGLSTATPLPFTREIKLDAALADTAELATSTSDFLGRPIKTTYGDGAAARSFYDLAGRLVRQVDPDGVQTLHAFTAATATSGEVQITALDMDRDGVIDYDGTDRITRQTTLVGTRSTYTVQRSTTEVWATDASVTPTVISVMESTPDGLRSWQAAYGVTTASLTTFDSGTGQRSDTVTLPDLTSQVRVSVGGRVVSETRKNSSGVNVTVTNYGYDAHGRPNAQTLVGVGTTTTTYYADDQPATVTTPDPTSSLSGPGYDPQATAYAYDAAGRVETVTHPDTTQTFTTYWPTGAVKRTWGSRTYPSEYGYDAQGRVKTLTTWQNFATTSGAAVTTWNYSPTRGWLTSKRYTDNTGPDYDYWPSGRLKTRDWARSVSGSRLRTSYVYNNAGDLSTINYADATPDVTNTYDRLARLKTTTDAAGLLTRTYQNGRLDDETYSAGSAHLSGLVVTRTQGTYNRPATLVATSLTSLSYGYDTAGRLSTLTQDTRVATLGYKTNVGSHQSTAVTVSGVPRAAMVRTTDNLGRITRVDTNFGAVLQARRDYTYNAANQRTEVVHEDALRWAYGYDALGQVTSAQKRNGSSLLLPGYDHVYAYDTIGNRVSTITNGRTATYTPDLRNQYVSRTTPPAYDVLGSAPLDVNVFVDDQPPVRDGTEFYREIPVSNAAAPVFDGVTILAARPGSPDQVASETRNAFVAQTPESFSYDLDGNLTQDGRWTYVWDAENRLIEQITRADVAAAAPGLVRQKLVFGYDAEGRRVRKQVYAWTGSAWATTPMTDLRFIYDGWNLLAEYNALASNAVVRSHVWGLDLSGSAQGAGGVGGLLWSTSGSVTYAAGWDANGNIVAWIDLANGTVAGRRDYSAFGEPFAATGASAALPFAFSTKYRDSETELYYYGLRYYNPSTGRWLSRDPIEERGGANIYVIAANDAVDFCDYLGLHLTKCEGYKVGPPLPALAAGQDSSGQDGAITTPDWTAGRKVTILDGSKLEVRGELSIWVSFRSGLDPDRARGVDGLTLREHEVLHVRIHKNWWNELKRSVDPAEGTYCGSSCAKLAADAVNTIADICYYSALIQNKQLDIDHNRSGISSASLSQLESARDNAKSEVENLRVKLDSIERKFKEKGCYKLQ